MAPYRLLNAVSEMQSLPLQSQGLARGDSTRPNGTEWDSYHTCCSLVKINSIDFQPFEVDYPVSLLTKRLHCEQKTHQKGASLGQERSLEKLS
jgi:hypothetical protein